MELTLEEISQYIDEISYGGKLVEVKKATGELVPFILKHSSLLEKIQSSYIYNKTYKKALDDGFLTKDEVLDLLNVRGLFTQKHLNDIAAIESKIAAQQKVLEKTVRVPANRKRLKKIIDSYREQINQILYKKESYLGTTAERTAQEEKLFFLLRKSCFNLDGETLYWDTEKSYSEERDLTLKQNLFQHFVNFIFGLDTGVIRCIARNPLWKVKYIAAINTGESVFGKAISEYSIDQVSLIYWSYYYNSLSEMMPEDRPPESVIEDDEALDAYMKDYFDERSREEAASKARKGKQSSAWDHKEVIVTKSNPIAQDIVYSKPKETLRNKKKSDLSVRDS